MRGQVYTSLANAQVGGAKACDNRGNFSAEPILPERSLVERAFDAPPLACGVPTLEMTEGVVQGGLRPRCSAARLVLDGLRHGVEVRTTRAPKLVERKPVAIGIKGDGCGRTLANPTRHAAGIGAARPRWLKLRFDP